MKRILLLDNYDSFTYNLVHYIEAITDVKPIVRRNNEISLQEVNAFDSIILSPGPGLPKDAGILPELIAEYHSSKKILGVCLGHQALAEFFGAKLICLQDVQHGVASPIYITQSNPLLNGLPQELTVGRYHSWVVDPATMPDSLQTLAVDNEKQIMALAHKTLPLWGVQFHPESILSEHGKTLLKNWVEA